MQTTETHHALVLDPDGLAVPHLDDLVLKGIAAVADAVDDGQRLLPLGLRAPPSKERKYERKPVFGLR